MGIESIVKHYRNTVTVTGDIIYPPGVTLRQRNCYVTGCYAVTLEAKRGAEAVMLRGQK